MRPRIFPSPPQAKGGAKPKTEFERFDELAKRILAPKPKASASKPSKPR